MTIVGEALGGRYFLTAMLGRGTSGIVYRAVDRVLDDELAVKILHPHLAGEPQFQARMRAELRNARRVAHPNILKVYQFVPGQRDPAFLTMELLHGGSLRDALNDAGAGLNCEIALRVLGQTLSALAALHRAGIIHRDLKPENLLLAHEQWVKVSDFSVASAATDRAALTQTGQTVGTPYYMSPEQCRGELTDPRTDLYSLGILGFELLSGRRPFDGLQFMEIAEAHQACPLPVGTLPADVPAWLPEFLARLAAKNPNDRFQSADEALSTLRQQNAGSEAMWTIPPCLPDGRSRKLKIAARRRRQAALLFAACVSLGSTAIIWAARTTRAVGGPAAAAIIAVDETCHRYSPSAPFVDGLCLMVFDSAKQLIRFPVGRDYIAAIETTPSNTDGERIRSAFIDAEDAVATSAMREDLIRAGGRRLMDFARGSASLKRLGARGTRQNFLHMAVALSLLPDTVDQVLLLKGVAAPELDTPDSIDRTPLMTAVNSGNPGLVRAYLRLGLNANRVDHSGSDALMTAAGLASPQGERISWLLLNANPGQPIDTGHRDVSGLTALFHAVEARQTRVLDIFLCAAARGVDFHPNVPTILGEAPLAYSVRYAEQRMIQQLLTLGATRAASPELQRPLSTELETMLAAPPLTVTCGTLPMGAE